MRNKFVSYQRTEIIGKTFVSRRGRKKTTDDQHPHPFDPCRMVIELTKDAGEFPAGLVIVVNHELGRTILSKKLGDVKEHKVSVDLTIEGEFEDAIEAMGLGLPSA